MGLRAEHPTEDNREESGSGFIKPSPSKELYEPFLLLPPTPSKNYCVLYGKNETYLVKLTKAVVFRTVTIE